MKMKIKKKLSIIPLIVVALVLLAGAAAYFSKSRQDKFAAPRQEASTIPLTLKPPMKSLKQWMPGSWQMFFSIKADLMIAVMAALACFILSFFLEVTLPHQSMIDSNG
jgi:hypothetical protein